MKPRPIISACCLLFVCSMPAKGSVEAGEKVIVSTRVFNGYERTRLPDGTFKPERFALGEGTYWKSKKVDPSLDNLAFIDIARTIARPLHQQGYLPTSDPQQTDLLILVSWGATTGASEGEYDSALPALSMAMNTVSRNGFLKQDSSEAETSALTSALLQQQAENRRRALNNARNAALLGYTADSDRATELRELGIDVCDHVIDELEANRYFVVLRAYDFPLLLAERKLKLLWEARFSIYEHGNRFDRQLLAMTQAAAPYFGHDTAGLVRRENLPDVKVELGTADVLEIVPDSEPDDVR